MACGVQSARHKVQGGGDGVEATSPLHVAPWTLHPTQVVESAEETGS
jgi:hypothetical protein